MPNWCEGNLKVEGNPTKVKELVDFLNTPFERNHKEVFKNEIVTTKYSNPVFSFWNVLKPEPEEMEEYTNSEYWYNWNIANWGTKWDIANVDGENYFSTHLDSSKLEDGVVYYNFSTAWSPCSPVIALISEKFPEVRLRYTYAEPGINFWGVEVYADGLVSEVGGESLSHEAYRIMGDVENCVCGWDSDEENYYKDCPKNVSVA